MLVFDRSTTDFELHKLGNKKNLVFRGASERCDDLHDHFNFPAFSSLGAILGVIPAVFLGKSQCHRFLCFFFSSEFDLAGTMCQTTVGAGQTVQTATTACGCGRSPAHHQLQDQPGSCCTFCPTVRGAQPEATMLHPTDNYSILTRMQREVKPNLQAINPRKPVEPDAISRCVLKDQLAGV